MSETIPRRPEPGLLRIFFNTVGLLDFLGLLFEHSVFFPDLLDLFADNGRGSFGLVSTFVIFLVDFGLSQLYVQKLS